MAVPFKSKSCCILNYHNLFYQIQNALTFNWDMCCHLVLCLWLLPFHYAPRCVIYTQRDIIYECTYISYERCTDRNICHGASVTKQKSLIKYSSAWGREFERRGIFWGRRPQRRQRLWRRKRRQKSFDVAENVRCRSLKKLFLLWVTDHANK